MPIIVEKPGKANECPITLPYGRVEKVQVKVGRFHWILDLEEGKVDLIDWLVDANAKDVKDLKKALTQFEEYLESPNKKEAVTCEGT